MRVWLVAVCACAQAAPPPPVAAPPPPVSNATHAGALACPTPPPDQVEPAEAPPWERDPLGRSPRCIETGDGARVRIEKDPSDAEGWRAFLVVEDDRGVRFRRPTRSAMSFALAPDGGVVIAHTEDAVSRFSPTGDLVWKSDHPKCGYADVTVGHDGRVVLGCGYSLVALSPDGKVLWQKWPFGNQTIHPPLLAADGTMIVRSGATIAKLDAAGEIVWHLDTGWNRYVNQIGVSRDGALVFRTSMAASHTDGPVHYYYDQEPEELFAVSLDGKILSRAKLAYDAHVWPASLPWTADFRSGRMPSTAP
jgi:hypothetical protein